MPPRNVVPKPVQQPHPPLWVACSRRDTILLAAEKGIGALSFAFVEPEDARQWVEDYEAVLAERCVPVGLSVNPQVACVTPMMCAPTKTRRWPAGSRGPTSSATRWPTTTSSATTSRPPTDVWQEFLQRRGKRATPPRPPWLPSGRPWEPKPRRATTPVCGARSAHRPSSASS